MSTKLTYFAKKNNMQLIFDYQKAIDKTRKLLEEYIISNKLNSLVIGLSGGIDSALVAALSYKVCQKLNIPLFGRSITIETNKPEEIQRAKAIGHSYTTDFREINLTDTYLNFRNSVVEDFDTLNLSDFNTKVRLGNVKARVRMVYLYELASRNKGLVMSTDNLTELLLGFWTLHGDVGDLGIIQQLWKTEVYEMSKFIAENEANDNQKNALLACVEAIPTDGLGITNSDLDQLKAPTYTDVDNILMEYLETKNPQLESNPVIQRYFNSHYKRNNPFNFKREIYF